MKKIEFYLSDKDFDRLYVIKKQRGKDDITGNDFACELLENLLYQFCPRVPDDYYENED